MENIPRQHESPGPESQYHLNSWVDLQTGGGIPKIIFNEDAALLMSLKPVCSLLRPVRRDLSMIRQDGRYGFRLLRVNWNQISRWARFARRE